MDKYIRDIVMTVATDVHNWALKKSHHPYMETYLSGWCAIASAELHRRLKKAGVDSEIHMSDNNCECHVYCVVDDHVVDVTASQYREFRNKDVVLLHHKEAGMYSFYNTAETFMCASSLRRHQKSTGWPSDQIAFRQ